MVFAQVVFPNAEFCNPNQHLHHLPLHHRLPPDLPLIYIIVLMLQNVFPLPVEEFY